MRTAKDIPIVPDAALAAATYDENCRQCSRLAAFLDTVRSAHPGYWCKPVPPFGDPEAPLVIVGLAPGMHGANASGRPFTGDHAGIILYRTLFDYGYASMPAVDGRGDGMRLTGCRITNAVKCLPPDNKPTPAEMRACNAFLAADLDTMPDGGAILALGRIAHDATLRALRLRAADHAFVHGGRHSLDRGRMLLDSYHCSRYNTNTRRLTTPMFRAVFDAVADHLGRARPASVFA